MAQPLTMEKRVYGTVVEALPNALFRVDVEAQAEESPVQLIAYLAGKMRINRIRVLVGDRVELALDQYGERGRITRRL